MFADEDDFGVSPLYTELSQVVAANDELLDLAARGRAGQYPPIFFLGAVHHLLLSGIDHPLAHYYPSVVGDQALAPSGVAAEFLSFCRQYKAEITKTLQTRLVQTNQVQRSLALRLGLSVIAQALPAPVHLIEVGTSAGLNLRFDRYGYQVGGQYFGDRSSTVQIQAELYGTKPLPNLSVLPEIASVQGVDLNPIDARDLDAVSWLEALVWPENRAQRALLAAALAVVAADPPPIKAGDAIDVLSEVGAQLPAGQPRVVFHAATRMHVPEERLGDFDAAIEALGDNAPLWWLSVEGSNPLPQRRAAPALPGAGLLLRHPDGSTQTIAVVNGHLSWIEMA